MSAPDATTTDQVQQAQAERGTVRLELIAHAILKDRKGKPQALSERTIYNLHCQGRVTWLTHTAHDGTWRRELWVIPVRLVGWARCEGYLINLEAIGNADARRAIERAMQNSEEVES